MSPRINVLGASGAGASSTARALGERLALPVLDSDDFFHGPSDPPFKAPRPPAERCALLEAAVAPHAGFVLGGGVAGWDPAPRLALTLVVFLHVPTEVRLARLRAREAARFGARIAPGGDMHEDHLAFLKWASRYDAGDVEGKTRARHEAWLATLACPVLRFEGERALDDIVAAVARAV